MLNDGATWFASFGEFLLPLLRSRGDVVRLQFSNVFACIFHRIRTDESRAQSLRIFLANPLRTQIVRLADLVVCHRVRLLLVENVGKLVVNRVEIVFREELLAFQSRLVQFVHAIHTHRVTTFCRSSGLQSLRVDSRRTNRHDGTWCIGFDKVSTSHFSISIQPKIFENDGEFRSLRTICRTQVVARFRVNVAQSVRIPNVVRVSVVLQQPLLKTIALHHRSVEDRRPFRTVIGTSCQRVSPAHESYCQKTTI